MVKSFSDTHPDCGLASAPVEVQRYVDGSEQIGLGVGVGVGEGVDEGVGDGVGDGVGEPVAVGEPVVVVPPVHVVPLSAERTTAPCWPPSMPR